MLEESQHYKNPAEMPKIQNEWPGTEGQVGEKALDQTRRTWPQL